MGVKTSRRHFRLNANKKRKYKKIITHQHKQNEKLREENGTLRDHIILLNSTIKGHIEAADAYLGTAPVIYNASRAGFCGRFIFAFWFAFRGHTLRG